MKMMWRWWNKICKKLYFLYFNVNAGFAPDAGVEIVNVTGEPAPSILPVKTLNIYVVC